MRIGSDIVGLKFRELKTSVTWRHTTNYAASTGDANPFYFDDRRKEGIIAPPMFAVAVTWPLVENLADYLELPCSPEIFQTMVHYSEHLEFLRPIRPGDRLSVNGRVAAVTPHRAGTLVVFEFSASDQQGRPVFHEHMGGLLRGVNCADSGKGGNNIPTAPRFTDCPSPVWEEAVPIRPEAPYIYDGCTNIVFPIHTSPAFAESAGLPGIILQGTATLAYAAARLVNREAGGDPSGLEAICCRFTGMVRPDSIIRVRLLKRVSGDNRAHLFFRVFDQQGQTAVNDGYARIKI